MQVVLTLDTDRIESLSVREAVERYLRGELSAAQAQPEYGLGASFFNRHLAELVEMAREEKADPADPSDPSD